MVERLTAAVGSTTSLTIHSLIFVGFFLAALGGLLSWSLMLLILTTLVSLEAIYLAIFIQITVNAHTQSLKEVEEDIDEIEEDIDEIQEDVEEMEEEERREEASLEKLTAAVQQILKDIESLKKS